MTAFSAMTDTLFSDPNLGVSATYCPANGPEIAVTVIRPPRRNTESPLFGAGVSAPADLAEVRVSEVAEAAENDALVIDGVRYRVRKAEYDDQRLTWVLDLDRRQ